MLLRVSGHFVYACVTTQHSQFYILVELPLGFTGVVLYLHRLCETITFTKLQIQVHFRTWVRKQCLHTCVTWSCQEPLCYSSASLHGSIRIRRLCMLFKHMPSPLTKGLVENFLRSSSTFKQLWLFTHAAAKNMLTICLSDLTAH